VPRLGAFHALHPHIDLHVHASYEPVDLNLGTIDLATRYGQGRYQDMQATLLFQDRFAPVASPLLNVTNQQALSQQTRAARLPDLDITTGIRYSDESHAIQGPLQDKAWPC
jgi:LysR family glycine cleavage system transcriptional activator